jgi:putative tricarboxylic transport membrane protein
MDFFSYLFFALRVATEPINLLMCFTGVFIGNLIGVLPGLGPVATISILLPITYKLAPIPSIIMLAGIYYGANYGGSTTSILMNIPGEASSMITCLDGYQMAKKGRAGAALGISAIGSFIGGTFGVIMMAILAPFLAGMALKFGPPENASLMFLGLTMVTSLSAAPMIKSLMMMFAGLLLGCIGTDLVTGSIRFCLGIPDLTDGLDIIAVVMGLFGISEVLLNIEEILVKREFLKTQTKGFKTLFPNKQEFKDSVGPIARGSIGGFILGVVPGGGALLASIMSYAWEKRLSKQPEKFGTGYIKGVAGPETANNSAAQGAYIPLMTLGIPTNVVMGVLMGGFLIHGLIPGPLLLTTHPDLFWGVVGSMYIGNVMLLILNLPLIGLWVKILDVPYKLLFPIILLICLIGSYTVNNSFIDIIIMIIFGVIGYLMKKFNCPAAPLVLSLVLGPMLEKNLGQSLMMSGGNFLIFFSRPISAALVISSFSLLFLPGILKLLRRKRPGLLIGGSKDL